MFSLSDKRVSLRVFFEVISFPQFTQPVAAGSGKEMTLVSSSLLDSPLTVQSKTKFHTTMELTGSSRKGNWVLS